ncbi:hypothetical protein Tco_0178932 [Tanacetum coccineum]
MSSYLKNMEGKKLKDLKNKSFDSIQKMFDRAFKRVNTFVDFRTDLVEGSSKRAGEELEQESTKKQKMDEDKDTTELQSLMEEDLKDLYKLVKAKYKSTRPVEDLDLLLWEDLKTMFEPHVEDTVWKNQQDYKVLEWKLYDSCGVHSLRMQHVYIYMLVEKRYPLTPSTITVMLNKKLQTKSMFDGTLDSNDAKWERFSSQVKAQFEGNDGGLTLESIDLLQRDMLRRLRFKFATKILLHEINVHAEKMLELAKEFDKIDPVEKMAIIIDALKNKEQRDRI